MKHLLLIAGDDCLKSITQMLKKAGYTVKAVKEEKFNDKMIFSNSFDGVICTDPLLANLSCWHTPALQHLTRVLICDQHPAFDRGNILSANNKDLNIVPGMHCLVDSLGKLFKPKTVGISHGNSLESFGSKNPVDTKWPILAALSPYQSIQHYKRKQLIYSEGHHPGRLFFIERGKVKVFKTDREGKELTVGLLTSGDFLGYTALLEEGVYKDTAQALDDSDIYEIPGDDFQLLMSSNREVNRYFIRLLAKDVGEKEAQLLGLAYNSMRKRVAGALITLYKTYKTGLHAQFSIHISRDDLARIAGTATESLIRTLSDFKNEKLIQIKAGDIIIPDGKGLQRILDQ